jgi:flagellar biosynthetic protein FliQ
MDTTYILYLGRHTLETALLVASPLLLVSIICGLVVSIFQAVTSLKDMTMTLVPKLLAMGITSMIFGNWMLQIIMKFTLEVFGQIQAYGS